MLAIALSVVNEKGQGFQTHTNWIQVRPGERRTCDGCHRTPSSLHWNSSSDQTKPWATSFCSRWSSHCAPAEGGF